MDSTEKVTGIIFNEGVRQIAVTHVTIHESISFLLLRLVTLEAVAAIGISILHSVIIAAQIGAFNIPIFIVLVTAKTLLMVYVVLQWLNEYYEITPNELIHKHGIFYMSQHTYKFEHLGSVRIEQGLIGRIFNYGTIRLFHSDLKEDLIMYLIHNPVKYYEILKTILPEADDGKRITREHVIEHIETPHIDS